MGNVCSPCRQKYRKLKLKLRAIEYKGGKCEICGYDRNMDVLEFHHLNPEEKEFAISASFNKSWEVIKAELDKCQMLCANCHRELHSQEHKYVSIEEYEKWITPISEQERKSREHVSTLKYQEKERLKQERIALIKSSNIDFSKFGWALKLSKILNITSAQTVRWIKKYMPVFYRENCYRENDIDSADISKVISIYNNCGTVQETAKKSGLRLSQVSMILKDNGIEIDVHNAKSISMLDKETGNLIKTFTSIKEASIYCESMVETVRSKNPSANNIANKISRCINGNQKSAYGFKWCLSDS